MVENNSRGAPLVEILHTVDTGASSAMHPNEFTLPSFTAAASKLLLALMVTIELIELNT